MKVVSSFSESKEIAFPESNEDSFSISKSCITLCDGASQSFASRLWSTKVAKNFAQRSVAITSGTVNPIIHDYLSEIDVASLSWAEAVSFENGSFSTILRLSLRNDRKLLIESVGDCLCAYETPDRTVATFPYQKPEDFEANPNTLSSRCEHNKNLFAKIQKRSINMRVSRRFLCNKLRNRRQEKTAFSRVGYRNRTFVLMMTDALGQWLCGDKQRNFRKLSELVTEKDFRSLISELRERKEIRVDDTTLLKVQI